MKTLCIFKDAATLHLSLDAVMPHDSSVQKIQALFVLGKPIVVRKGQRLIATTEGIWLEELPQEEAQDA